MKNKPREKDAAFQDEHHISEQLDGTSEQDMGDLGRCEEEIETKINEDDGVLEDHITYKQCTASRYFFGNSGNKRFVDKFDDIDWNK